VARLRKQAFVRQAQRLVRRYIKEFGRPDLIHAHAVKWGGVAAEAIADDLRLPFVVTEHSTAFPRGAVEPWEEVCFRQAFERADRVLAVSRALAESLARYMDPARVEVVPNVVDTEFFSLPPAPRSSPPFTFVVVAALRRKKGLDVLLRAFRAAFGESSEKVRLRIGGGGPLADELKNLSRSLGLEDRVAFLGRLSRQEVRREMWEANVAVLPSRVETFGVVVIEAMSTGLPVLATRCGGPEEIITEDTGWLVEPEDPQALAEGLRTALEGASYLGSSAERIRGHVCRRYSESAVANRLRNVYRAVVGSERGRS
jgi:glycosyltransferase involved in cell wall biosynthesis